MVAKLDSSQWNKTGSTGSRIGLLAAVGDLQTNSDLLQHQEKTQNISVENSKTFSVSFETLCPARFLSNNAANDAQLKGQKAELRLLQTALRVCLCLLKQLQPP